MTFLVLLICRIFVIDTLSSCVSGSALLRNGEGVDSALAPPEPLARRQDSLNDTLFDHCGTAPPGALEIYKSWTQEPRLASTVALSSLSLPL